MTSSCTQGGTRASASEDLRAPEASHEPVPRRSTSTARSRRPGSVLSPVGVQTGGTAQEKDSSGAPEGPFHAQWDGWRGRIRTSDSLIQRRHARSGSPCSSSADALGWRRPGKAGETIDEVTLPASSRMETRDVLGVPGVLADAVQPASSGPTRTARNARRVMASMPRVEPAGATMVAPAATR